MSTTLLFVERACGIDSKDIFYLQSHEISKNFKSRDEFGRLGIKSRIQKSLNSKKLIFLLKDSCFLSSLI